MNSEIWKPIPGFNDWYEASNLGRIRSKPRTIPRSDGTEQQRRGTVLKPGRSRGYPTVVLCNNTKRSTQNVHSLVAAAFLGPRPEGAHVRHIDGTRDNNVPENLTYGTRSENTLDSVNHGTHNQARVDRCPRGHLYAKGNLVTSQALRGKRACRACKNSWAWLKSKGMLTPESWQQVSDKYYASFEVEQSCCEAEKSPA